MGIPVFSSFFSSLLQPTKDAASRKASNKGSILLYIKFIFAILIYHCKNEWRGAEALSLLLAAHFYPGNIAPDGVRRGHIAWQKPTVLPIGFCFFVKRVLYRSINQL